MHNIDNLFSKLKGTEHNAPDIWNKIETELSNPNRMTDNANDVGMRDVAKSITRKTTTITTAVKTIGIITATAIVGIGTYLIADNYLENTSVSKEIHLKTNTNNTNTIISNSTQHTQKDVINIAASKENSSEIKNKANTKQEQNKDIIIEYNIKDDPYEVLSSENYTIEPIKNHTNTSELIINNKVEIVKQEENKISSVDNDIPEFFASNVITPNGDGINDYFIIKNVDKFPENSIVIMDSRGKIVFRRKGYDNSFSAVNLPIGTYFYTFEYNNLGKNVRESGSITVMQ